jgi:hypothetical protein
MELSILELFATHQGYNKTHLTRSKQVLNSHVNLQKSISNFDVLAIFLIALYVQYTVYNGILTMVHVIKREKAFNRN